MTNLFDILMGVVGLTDKGFEYRHKMTDIFAEVATWLNVATDENYYYQYKALVENKVIHDSVNVCLSEFEYLNKQWC